SRSARWPAKSPFVRGRLRAGPGAESPKHRGSAPRILGVLARAREELAQLRLTVNAETAPDALQVVAHGLRADEEAPSDRLDLQAAEEVVEDFALAHGEHAAAKCGDVTARRSGRGAVRLRCAGGPRRGVLEPRPGSRILERYRGRHRVGELDEQVRQPPLSR